MLKDRTGQFCRITYVTDEDMSKLSKQKGITLVEILVVMAITSLVGVLLVRILVNNTGLFVKQTAKVQQGLDLNDSLTKVRSDIRQSASVGESYPEGAITATPTPAPNLLSNPGFETDLSNWTNYHASTQRIAGASAAHSGTYGAKVINDDTSYSIDNWPGEATNLTFDTNYIASAWVKGEGNTVGKTVGIIIREHNDDLSIVEETTTGDSTTVQLTTSWQQISGSHRIVNNSGLTNVDVYVYQGTAEPGDSFYVDDFVFKINANGQNLLHNPGFESNLDWWGGYYADLTRVSGFGQAHSGTWGAKVATKSSYSIDNWVGEVPNPIQDKTYNASVWVRTDTGSPSIGKPIGLIIREHNGGEDIMIDSTNPVTTLTDQWQKITTTHTVLNPSMTNLNVYAYQDNATTGHYFYADDFELTEGAGGGTPPPTPPELFTSSSTTLVLKIPSIDIVGNTINNVFDFAVYYKDGNKLRYRLFRNPSSYRKEEDRILANNVDSILFKYYDLNGEVSPTASTKVKAVLTLKEKAGISFESNIATSEAKLRNK